MPYEIRGRVASNRNAELISTSEAEMIVRSLIDSNADYVRIRSDYDDGIYIYEADMYAQGIDYEVELNAATGDVIKFSFFITIHALYSKQLSLTKSLITSWGFPAFPFLWISSTTVKSCLTFPGQEYDFSDSISRMGEV